MPLDDRLDLQSFGIARHGGEIKLDGPARAGVLPEANHGFGPFQQALVAVGGDFFRTVGPIGRSVPIALQPLLHRQTITQKKQSQPTVGHFSNFAYLHFDNLFAPPSIALSCLERYNDR